MTSIFKASGFKNLESLKEFCDRFPEVSTCLDEDLQKIWICHKNSENIPTFEEISSLPSEDYNFILKKIKRKVATEKPFHSLLTEFSALSIFEKLYCQFGNQLTNYLITKCYLFYNWGINAFEPVFDHFEIHGMIQECQKKNPKPNPRKQYNDIELKNVNVSNGPSNRKQEISDLFKPNEKFTKSKLRRFKSLVPNSLKTRKFYELTKNSRNPYHEMFTLNKILYDMKQRSRFSKNNILSTKNVEDLILFIIRIPVGTDSTTENKLLMEHKKWKILKKVLINFMINHDRLSKNNGYGRILKRQLKNVKAPSDRRLFPIPISKVCIYITYVLKKVLPVQLFGWFSMQKYFFSKFVKIIKGNKKETFIWHSLLHPLLKKKNFVPWIEQIDNYYIQSQVVLKVFKFIVFYYAFEILRNNFYISETGSSGFGLRYYRKGDMESASTICLNRLLQNGHICHLVRMDEPTVERNWLNTRVIAQEDLKRNLKIKMSPSIEYKQPIAHIRFLPKSDDSDALRIITFIPKNFPKSDSFKSPSKRLVKFFKERESRRRKNNYFVKLFLEYLVDKKGLGIQPLPSNPRLEEAWKRAVHLNEKYGKLFFVKADISDAFNSVKYSILTEILHLAIQKELENGNVKLRKITEWKSKNWKIYKEVRFSFSNRTRENAVMIQRSFFLDSNKTIKQHFDLKFLQILKQVVMQQEIEINGKIFKLKRGLAQGSAGRFSSQLCEIYYSSMDRLFFGDFINSRDSILLRAVDDYLLISSDLKKAEQFLKIVQSGIKEYNVRFNHHKLKSNLIENINEVTYLGLVFNFKSMSVKPDYSKYYQNGFLSTINLFDKWGNNHFNKELFLRKRLLCMRYLKLNPIALNGIHNNLKILRQVVFEACWVQSLRVLTLANYLYCGNTKDDFAIYSVLSITCSRIRKMVASTNLTVDECNWLFFFAASVVVKKYSGQFSILLKLIHSRLQHCENAFASNGTQALITFLKNDISEIKMNSQI